MRGDRIMRPDDRPTPTQIIGELLVNHPEAARLLAAATRWRTLAAWSAAVARRKFAVAQAARLAYEELGHLLEPRRRHPVNRVTGLLLLPVRSAGLEPARLLAARRRWYRARAAYEAATETGQADARAAAVARESWLGLVRARVTAIAPDDDHLAQATVARAATLVGRDRPQLPLAE
jgi:hypothetical protein